VSDLERDGFATLRAPCGRLVPGQPLGLAARFACYGFFACGCALRLLFRLRSRAMLAMLPMLALARRPKGLWC